MYKLEPQNSNAGFVVSVRDDDTTESNLLPHLPLLLFSGRRGKLSTLVACIKRYFLYSLSITLIIMLPQYSKQYKTDDISLEGDEANEPFLNASHRESTETAPPTYPPSLPATQTGRSNVQYKYEPVYPRKGSRKMAVGLMGRTKQVSHFIRTRLNRRKR
jgi:hypothetical protein